jgi:hypothetical protein
MPQKKFKLVKNYLLLTEFDGIFQFFGFFGYPEMLFVLCQKMPGKAKLQIDGGNKRHQSITLTLFVIRVMNHSVWGIYLLNNNEPFLYF